MQLVRSVLEVIEAGAVGTNLEDVADFEEKRLLPLEEQLERLRRTSWCEGRGVPIVLNARTDAFRFHKGDESERLKEAIERCRAFRKAGVDCVYPMGLVTHSTVSEFLRSVGGPANVMVRKGLPPGRRTEETWSEEGKSWAQPDLCGDGIAEKGGSRDSGEGNLHDADERIDNVRRVERPIASQTLELSLSCRIMLWK